MLHHVPSPLPLTLLMASDPEFLGAGLDPYRKLTGAKNSAQRTNRVLQVPEVGRCWQGQNSPKGEFKVDRGEMGGHQEFLPHSPTILSNTAPFCHFLVLRLALFVLSLITS